VKRLSSQRGARSPPSCSAIKPASSAAPNNAAISERRPTALWIGVVWTLKSQCAHSAQASRAIAPIAQAKRRARRRSLRLARAGVRDHGLAHREQACQTAGLPGA